MRCADLRLVGGLPTDHCAVTAWRSTSLRTGCAGCILYFLCVAGSSSIFRSTFQPSCRESIAAHSRLIPYCSLDEVLLAGRVPQRPGDDQRHCAAGEAGEQWEGGARGH